MNKRQRELHKKSVKEIQEKNRFYKKGLPKKIQELKQKMNPVKRYLLRKKVKRAITLLNSIDIMQSDAGWSRSTRKKWWNSFMKNPATRMLVFKNLEQKAKKK